MEGERLDSHFRGNDIWGVGMTEGLKLTIFTYKWGKCVKAVGKYLLESLAI